METVRTFMPNLILLEVGMPGLNGGEVAKALAADSDLRWIPVLFVTSLLSTAERGSCPLHRGDQLFLAKLVEPSGLIGAAGEMLAERRRAVSRQ
jgi:CheY-like chemotaxis protein